jgi:hypothetical protein
MKSLAAAFAFAATAATAQAQGAPQQSPELVRRLIDCRKLAAAEARLACFDDATSAIAAAIDGKDLVVADRAQISKARRSIFGLAMPDLDRLFGGGGGDTSSRRGEGADEITATVARSFQSPRGEWTMILDDGSRWVQTDTRELLHDPKKGSTIRIRRAAMGSFLANIDGQIAIRVRRQID